LVGVLLHRAFGPVTFPQAMGLAMPAMIASMALSPVFAGRVRDLTGSYGPALIFCACLMAAGTVAVVIFRTVPFKPITQASE
jgi:MFS family permease